MLKGHSGCVSYFCSVLACVSHTGLYYISQYTHYGIRYCTHSFTYRVVCMKCGVIGTLLIVLNLQVNTIAWNGSGTRLLSGSDDCHLNIYASGSGLVGG